MHVFIIYGQCIYERYFFYSSWEHSGYSSFYMLLVSVDRIISQVYHHRNFIHIKLNLIIWVVYIKIFFSQIKPSIQLLSDYLGACKCSYFNTKYAFIKTFHCNPKNTSKYYEDTWDHPSFYRWIIVNLFCAFQAY